MKMVRVRTESLTDRALDFAVAAAVYPKSHFSGGRLRVRAMIEGEESTIGAVFLGEPATFTPGFSPSTDWAQGGPLIESYGVELMPVAKDRWAATATETDAQFGVTPLVAAMRAIVVSVLGEAVDVPEVLV